MHRGVAEALKRWLPRLGVRLSLVRALRYEAQMLRVRMRAALSLSHRRRVHQLRRRRALKINLGSGAVVLDGWVNVDAVPGRGVDLSLDLRRPLPFADGSAQFIFAEHILEHLEYPDEARHLLAECYRILAPGGVLRLAVPHGSRFLEAYLACRSNFFALVSPEAATPMEALNQVFRAGGAHKFTYDFETLRCLLEQAGFRHTVESAFGQSAYPELRVDLDLEHRREETLYVEAVK